MKSPPNQTTHLGQTPPDCPCLLGSEVKRLVLLVLVEITEVLAGFLVDDSQDPGDRLANSRTVNFRRKYQSPVLTQQPVRATHILVSFAADPPAIFCTRRVRSSFLSSFNCLYKSFFDLVTQVSIFPSVRAALDRYKMRTWIGARRP